MTDSGKTLRCTVCGAKLYCNNRSGFCRNSDIEDSLARGLAAEKIGRGPSRRQPYGRENPDLARALCKIAPTDDDRWSVAVYTGIDFEVFAVFQDRGSAEHARAVVHAGLREAILTDRERLVRTR